MDRLLPAHVPPSPHADRSIEKPRYKFVLYRSPMYRERIGPGRWCLRSYIPGTRPPLVIYP